VNDPNTILIHYLTTYKSDTSESSSYTGSPFHYTIEEPDSQLDFVCEDSGSPGLQITDFSPEWDFCEGGAKMLLCYSAEGNQNPDTLAVWFGSKFAETTVIQPGVLKCYVPPNNPGNVSLKLSCAATSLTSAPESFSYREAQKSAFSLISEDEWTEMSDESFKVRIIERLENIS
jgi:hypothetical protein